MAAGSLEESEIAAHVSEQDQVLAQDPDRNGEIAHLGVQLDGMPESTQILAARSSPTHMGQVGVLLGRLRAVIGAVRAGQTIAAFFSYLPPGGGTICARSLSGSNSIDPDPAPIWSRINNTQ